MDLHSYLPAIVQYVGQVNWSTVPGWQVNEPWDVLPLAQGEYNMNYLICQEKNRWVLRVNLGSQIGRRDQIAYEYRALRLLETSGVTPRPYWLDDRKTGLAYGTLLMEYLPGEPLDYEVDLQAAAGLFARLHSHPISPVDNHLIRETHPLSEMYAECKRMADVYFTSELNDPVVACYLGEVLDWANTAREGEVYYLSDPWSCVINTEVNSGNFIANRETSALHLVDWEKPLWGDPSQDLSHFGAPTTTLWKTGYRMSSEDRRDFLAAYRQAIPDPHLKDTIIDRVHLRDPFNCLRGVTWSAMAYVQYQTGNHLLCNPDTFVKIQQYLQVDFLRSLFDGCLERGRKGIL